jgi:TM2 domain-containing membrane protein YozV
MFCNHCGAQMGEGAGFCPQCGTSTSGGASPKAAAPQPQPTPGWTAPAPGLGAPKAKLVAALLGIFVGAFGVHRFYLGYTAIGIAQLVLGVLGIVTCGITTLASAIWGLVEGILILTGSINCDAQGRPLTE